LTAFLRSPGIAPTVVTWGLFAAVCALMAIWAWDRPLVAAGRVMNETAVVRAPFSVEDRAATEEARKAERQRTPRVYVAEMAVIQEIQASLVNLPRTVASAASLEQVDPQIREEFGLTLEGLAALQAEATDGQPSEAWTSRVGRLMKSLVERPLLDAKTWQRESQSLNRLVELRIADDSLLVPSGNALNVEEPERVQEAMRQIVREAGFPALQAAAVLHRLAAPPTGSVPTYRFDEAATRERQKAAEAAVRPRTLELQAGHVIFTRGEVLTADAYELYRTELEQFRTHAPAWRVQVRRGSIAGAVGAVSLALAGYIGMFCPGIRRSGVRQAGIAALLAGALGVACWSTVIDPRLIMLTAITPTVFVGVILVVAYDQRVGLAFAVLHGLLVCTALRQPIGMLALMITGVGAAVWTLKEIRDRASLIRMAAATGVALALGTIIVALIDRPVTVESIDQTASDAALAGFGGLLVGMVTLFILPWIERVFDATTSMTLIELRDPKQPLLRELQQRAPGTYSHSLNVANLAEAAAEAIHVNSLLAYVGALYHDVGKMNKPEYFVENQPPGVNKHDRLSPAMSLLVIVGHVKDGMELAREFSLPHVLHHFIEAHHGTTLVEYFYHRARRLAAVAAGGGAGGGAGARGEGEEGGGEEGPGRLPSEVEYRYPGPKPRTKEAAIVMICDAVESAARSMPNPTPGRIEAVVRALATKRLMDGQFDECDLTLRELNLVVEAVSKTLASIYHNRVAYPEEPEEPAEGPRTGDYRLEEADLPAGASEALGRAG
jgi:putative nucleotidyltransferase with HDIG domain